MTNDLTATTITDLAARGFTTIAVTAASGVRNELAIGRVAMILKLASSRGSRWAAWGPAR